MQAQGEQSQTNVQHLLGQSLAHIAEAERLLGVAPAEAQPSNDGAGGNHGGDTGEGDGDEDMSMGEASEEAFPSPAE